MSGVAGRWLWLMAMFMLCLIASDAAAADSEWNRKTLAGIQAVYVVIEDLQANVQRYAPKVSLTKEQLRKDVESRLQKAGIRLFNQDEWLKTKGRPTLYVNINTHEFEKYSYAYDIRVELQQVVQMEGNPAVRILTDTWSISQTGVFNVGSAQTLRSQLGVLMDRFVEAYSTVNQKKEK